MDQWSICLFFDRQRFSAEEVHRRFFAVLGSDAIVYSIITEYSRRTRDTADKEMARKMEVYDGIDQVIVAALDGYYSRQCKT
jgi:hypothetical protein